MVPVRKPGRPLSACPHPRDQACGCGSVTAAISRKQKTCHCGGEDAASRPDGASTPLRPTSSPGTELSSPTRYTFKVGKPKPASGRKASFDLANLERMDASQLYIQPYDPPQMPLQFQNGYAMAAPPMYGYVPQYAQPQAPFMLPLQPPPPSMPRNGTHAYANGGLPHASLGALMERSLATPPTSFGSAEAGTLIGGAADGPETTFKHAHASPAPNGDACCAPKPGGHKHTSSSSSTSELSEAPTTGGCSSRASKTESMASTPTTPQMDPRLGSQNGIHFNPVLYPQFPPQPTVFTYPATYGSFQNPLQPSAWRQSLRTNHCSQSSFPPGQLPIDAPLAPGSLETILSCCCGDSCQCVGCAAHPYNAATQDYVRSACNTQESGTGEPYAHGLSNGTGTGNGVVAASHPSAEAASSPTAHTPSSTTSGAGEEQTLPAADFFFVSYPFSGDGCGGDTRSCPCGDDCECLGVSAPRRAPDSPATSGSRSRRRAPTRSRHYTLTSSGLTFDAVHDPPAAHALCRR